MSPEKPGIVIAGRRVAADQPPFVIGEIGLNHGGSVDRALALVDAAAAAGADAIKLQTIVARELVAPACPPPAHVAAASLADFFATFELDQDAHWRVMARARARGLATLSTPFSESAVDLLEQIGVDAYKIASGDLTWDQLIVRVAATGKPMVISTGMASLDEVRHAVALARSAGAHEIALLHCVSAYPVPTGSENLLAIRTLANAFGVPVGLSDHGSDTFALPIAVTIGAAIYERHLVLEGDDEAIDRPVSSRPEELAIAIRDGRRAASALGTGRKRCLDAELPNVIPSRRSWCAARALPAGTTITASDLIALRPGSGIAPGALSTIVGRPLIVPVAAGQPITAAFLAPHQVSEADRVA